MICLETSGGWVASLMSERIVMTGVRSRRFRIGSSRRISEWPIWSSGMAAVPAHQREIRQTRRVQPLAAGAACHDGDIADVLADLRDGDAGEEELSCWPPPPARGR